MRSRWVALVACAVLSLASGQAAVAGTRVAGGAWTETCDFLYEHVTDCRSSNPTVNLDLLQVGDTSACTFNVHVNWGDKTTRQDLLFTGGPNGPKFLANHHYARRGTYSIVVTGSVASGPCYFYYLPPFTFHLVKVSAKLRLAALGDSFSAGNGTRQADGNCMHSPKAWPRLLATKNPVVGMTAKDLLACSGASSAKFSSQLERLRTAKPRPTLVTLTLGGNDVLFSKVLEDCFRKDCIADGTITKAAQSIVGERNTLKSDYDRLRRADPNATDLIVGYPHLFDTSHGCGRYKQRELVQMIKLEDALNTEIRAAASKARAGYVDITHVLKDHEMCAKHSWVYEVGIINGVLHPLQIAHPTEAGQQAIANKVRAYINKTL